MITHRVATKISPLALPEPPVRFYKTIAISFLAVTIIMLGIVIFFTSKKAVIVVGSKNDNKTISFTTQVEPQKTSDANIVGSVSSTFFTWSKKYFPTGNRTEDGVATGEVIIYNKTNTDQVLVKITRLLTPNNVMFRLSDRVTVPANGQVTAAVYADQSGTSSEIGPSQFTIPGLSEDKQKVINAESVAKMVGGTKKIGILTEEDLRAAEADYVEAVKIAFASSSADQGSVISSVVDHTVKSDHRAGEEVSEFTLSGKNTVVVVSYNKDDIIEVADREIAKQIDTGMEKVLSINKDPKISLTSYDLVKGAAYLSVSQDVLVTLDVNGEKLAAYNFFNKSKDQIERYVLGLSHVAGVDVKFSPAWMRTTPSAQDHIKVIVKNVL